MSGSPTYDAERNDDHDEIDVNEVELVDDGEDAAGDADHTPAEAASQIEYDEQDHDGADMEMAPCAFCGEPHPVGAWRCRACNGFLPIIEETIHKEHFFFMFCSLSMFLGTFLVWEPKTWITGSAGILGGFLIVTSAYACFASVINIFNRRMIVWPHLTAMVLGLWAGWQRVVQLVGDAGLVKPAEGAPFGEWKLFIDQIFHIFGPGLYIVVIVSTMLLVFMIVSIFVAGKRDAARKAAMRSERTTDRGGRRRR